MNSYDDYSESTFSELEREVYATQRSVTFTEFTVVLDYFTVLMDYATERIGEAEASHEESIRVLNNKITDLERSAAEDDKYVADLEEEIARLRFGAKNG